MTDLIDFQKVKAWILNHWAKSLPYILFLLFGIAIGMVVVEGRIVDDCRYMNKFRFGSQVFNCGRVM